MSQKFDLKILEPINTRLGVEFGEPYWDETGAEHGAWISESACGEYIATAYLTDAGRWHFAVIRFEDGTEVLEMTAP